MTGIKALQGLYLKTGNNEYLSQMYKELIRLGKCILAAEKFPNDIEDVYDVASNICMRLIESQQPVIGSAASAYVKNSLFFMNKQTFHDSLSEIEVEFYDNPNAEDVEELINELIAKANMRPSGAVRELVIYCLTYQKNWHEIKKTIADPQDRSEFTQIMKEVKSYVKKDNL